MRAAPPLDGLSYQDVRSELSVESEVTPSSEEGDEVHITGVFCTGISARTNANSGRGGKD